MISVDVLPTAADAEAFIRGQTIVARPPLVPEIRLHLATEITPIWHATEKTLQRIGLAPPFWAFPWAGGQALARYVLDHPGLVAGRTVLDIGAGSGLIAIAAALCGAARVRAAEVDPFAGVAIGLNAALNNVTIEPLIDDLIGRAVADDIVLVGDMCYERPLAERLVRWLRDVAGAGTVVLMADPGRTYGPTEGVKEVARYTVPTSLELEDRTERETVVWAVGPQPVPVSLADMSAEPSTIE